VWCVGSAPGASKGMGPFKPRAAGIW